MLSNPRILVSSRGLASHAYSSTPEYLPLAMPLYIWSALFRLLSKCARVSFPATNRLLPQDAVLSLFSNSRCGATLPSHLHLPGASRGRRPQRPHPRRSRSWDCRRCDTCRAPVPWHPLWEAARPWSPIRPSVAGTAVWRTERDRDAPQLHAVSQQPPRRHHQ